MESFIRIYKVDKKLCDELIKYHKSNVEYKAPGETGHGIDKNYKDLASKFGFAIEAAAKTLHETQIANHLGITGSSSYVRVSQLKKQAIDKLIDNVDRSQVIDFE